MIENAIKLQKKDFGRKIKLVGQSVTHFGPMA